MRKLQNLRQPTIKGNEWQRTNAERQILVKKQQRHQNEQIRKRPNHSILKLPQTHRLHFFIACKRRCNAISTETITTKPVKQQANFTTSKQSCTKPAPLAITTPHAPLPPLHNLQKTQCNAQSTETVATETRETTITFTAGTVNRNFSKQKRHGYRAFWCDFQKNCQADKNRVVTVCPVTQKPNYCFARSMYSPVRVSMRM